MGAPSFLLLPAVLVVWAVGRRTPTQLMLAALLTLVLGPIGVLMAGLLPLLAELSQVMSSTLGRQVWFDAVRESVPSLLTDLTMAAEAGQPLHAALRYARLYRHGPMAQSLQEYIDRTGRGESVVEALEALRLRLGVPETDRLVELLKRDSQLGLPLATSVARYRQAWLGAMRRAAARTGAYMPYVFTALAGVLLMEGVALIAIPWLSSLWHGF